MVDKVMEQLLDREFVKVEAGRWEKDNREFGYRLKASIFDGELWFGIGNGSRMQRWTESYETLLEWAKEREAERAE